jgi:hypothetical protein
MKAEQKINLITKTSKWIALIKETCPEAYKYIQLGMYEEAESAFYCYVVNRK